MKCPPIPLPKQFCLKRNLPRSWEIYTTVKETLFIHISGTSTFHQLEPGGQSLHGQSSGYDLCWSSPAQSRLLSTPDSLSCSYCYVPPRDRDNSPGRICTAATLHVAHKHEKPVGWGAGNTSYMVFVQLPKRWANLISSFSSPQASRNLSNFSMPEEGDQRCPIRSACPSYTEFKSPK